MRSVHGDAVAWGATEHLLATAIDVLAAANWQRGGDKKAPRPKPLPRPGKVIAGTRSRDELRDRLLDLRERDRRRKARQM